MATPLATPTKRTLVSLVGEVLMGLDGEAFAAFAAEATGVELSAATASGDGVGVGRDGASSSSAAPPPLWSLRSAVTGRGMGGALEAVHAADPAFLSTHPLLHARCLHQQCWELVLGGQMAEATHVLHTAVLPLLSGGSRDDAVREVAEHTCTAVALGGR
jgi:hypothetical protein